MPRREAIRGYCAAVRSALTDDGRPPLEASGLKLVDRLTAVAASLDRVAAKRGCPKELIRLRAILGKGLEATAALWPDVRVAFGWVHRAAAVLRNKKGLDAAGGAAALSRPGRGDRPACRAGRRASAAAFDALPQGDAELLAGAVPVLRRRRTCRGRTTTWSSSSARIATTSGVPAAGRWPARGRWCGARCGWSRRRRPGCGRRKAWCCGRAMWRTGESCERSWSSGARRGGRSDDSATTRRPTSRSWSNSASS